MTGSDLKLARAQRRWTQQQMARRLRVTQAYLSMLEAGRRPVPDDLALRVARLVEVSPLTLPLEQRRSTDLAADLGVLGYPGFAYMQGGKPRNPASLLLDAISREHLDARVAEALQWLVFQYAEMNWNWLIPRVKVRDRQNRLGFLVSLARQLAERKDNPQREAHLKDLEERLQRSRLLHEDTFGAQLTGPERDWLQTQRSEQARFWNVLSDLKPEFLDAGQ
ncbi:MAG TPA: helix-turn-helix transcriptional regulator, partial [Terriglobales bacterium]|nr:helix-turn-helix transcriptional regulator [Terriglobales bacterium]